jgi:hypothetical protein
LYILLAALATAQRDQRRFAVWANVDIIGLQQTMGSRLVALEGMESEEL